MNYQGRRRRGNRRKRRNRPLAEPCDDYYVVIDFEATTRQIAEIIEFPALLIDARTLEYVSQFHSYVRPVIYRYLDKRCKRLTGITQSMVNKSPVFEEVLDDFHDWLFQYIEDDKTFVVVTDGSADMGNFFFNQCKQSNIQMPYWARQWIDLKNTFKQIYHLSYMPSLPRMVEHFRMAFIGQWHSGHDDVLNIAAVLCRMLCKGYEFQPDHYICDKCIQI